MNKFFRSTLLTSMLAAGLAACGDDVTVVDPPPPPPPPAPAVHSITVGPDGGSVTVGATLTMVAAVNADAGVATTVTWSSSDNAKATVSAAGVVTGVAAGSVGIKACSTVNTSVCGVATVAVVDAPVATVTAVVITPPSATLVIGQSITASANVQGTNSPSQAVTWSSLAPAVATVDANGVVTAVANGTAVIKATSNANSSIAGTMSVTVFTPQPATISIQSITQGNLATPVTLTNVNGQIEITLNVDNGAYTITKAQALVNGSTVIAEQVFASASASAAAAAVPSTVVLSLNTRQVQKAGSLYVPVIFNGPNSITARIFVAGATNPISSNAVPVVMKNADSWVAGTTPVLAPVSTSPSFVDATPTTWYKSDVSFTGGPNYISFFPVTPTIEATSNFCNNSADAVSGTPQTGITLAGTFDCLTNTFEGAVALNGFNVTAGTAPAADVVYIAADTEDMEQVGTAYSVAGSSRYNLLTGGPSVPGNTGNTVAVDNQGPSISANEIGFVAACSGTIPNPGCWIGSAYNLQNDFVALDGGTGVASKTITDYVTTTSVVVCGTTPYSAALLAEDPSPIKYDACALATDNIGNVSATIRGANQFGVDKTAPTIAYAGTYVSDSTVVTTVGAGNIDYQVNDNNSGLDANAVTLDLATLIADAAPACASGTIAAPIAAAAAGVDRQLTAPIASADNACGDQGYYTWTASVTDRAGNNTAATSPIVAAVDRTSPAIQAVAPQPLYRAGQNATLLVFATDSTDLSGVQLDVRYQATNSGGTSPVDLRYQITSGFGTVWDNVLTTITTPSTGFPATIPGNQVFGSFVIDTTVGFLGGPDSAFTQVKTTALDFNIANASATVTTPIPAVYKNNAFFPVSGVTVNPWATTGIQSGATFSGAGACTYTYDTPTNGPTIPVQVLVANEVTAGTLYEILFSITTTGNGLGASDNPKLISDNGTFRRYRYSISSATCASLGTPRLIAVKNDSNGLPSAYLVP